MSKKDIFSDIDNQSAEKIASEYPALNKAEKERIYALIKQKQGSSFDSEATVTGVERFTGHAWRRAAGMAAAFVLIAGIGGGTLFLHLSRVRRADRLAAAEQLTDDFLTAANLLTADVSDNSYSVCFYQYSTRNEEWNGGDVHYAKVNGDSFRSSGELAAFIGGLVTDEYMNELRQSGGEYFSAGIDELLSGSDDTAPRIMTYCGQLYASQTDTAPAEYTTPPLIVDASSGGMTVRRDTDVSLEFRIVRDGAEWKITDIERTSE